MMTLTMPAASGDWAADCATGRDSAAVIIAEMRGGGSPLLLQQAARQLGARPSFDGIAGGFYAALADRLI